jgi:hypothetical protein
MSRDTRKNEKAMVAKHVVVVGQRHYDVDYIEPGRWTVSRGGIPTGYIRQRDGECTVDGLVVGEDASEELVAVLDEVKKQSWWR